MMINLKDKIDNIFWDLSPDTNISKYLDALNDFYNDILDEAEKVNKNLFLLRAVNLDYFSKILSIYNRNVFFSPVYQNFEYFRTKVISVWMATITAPTYEMINWLAGGYSFQPCFIVVGSFSNLFAWTLNNCYLDGNANNPIIYTQPRTWLRSPYAFQTMIQVQVFSDGVNQLAYQEEFNEFEMLLKKLYGPYKVYIKLFPFRESPPDYYLFASFSPYNFNFILNNMNLDSGGFYFYIKNPGTNASLETSDRMVNQGIYEFNAFEVILSDNLERSFFYSLDSGNTWIEIKPLDKIQLISNNNMRFKVVLESIRDKDVYRFFSIMLHRL